MLLQPILYLLNEDFGDLLFMLRKHIIEIVKWRFDEPAILAAGFARSIGIPDSMVAGDKHERVL